MSVYVRDLIPSLNFTQAGYSNLYIWNIMCPSLSALPFLRLLFIPQDPIKCYHPISPRSYLKTLLDSQDTCDSSNTVHFTLHWIICISPTRFWDICCTGMHLAQRWAHIGVNVCEQMSKWMEAWMNEHMNTVIIPEAERLRFSLNHIMIHISNRVFPISTI